MNRLPFIVLLEHQWTTGVQRNDRLPVVRREQSVRREQAETV